MKADTVKKIEVMQAFVDGKCLEMLNKYCIRDSTPWFEVENPNWDWRHFEYRIKKIKKKGWVNVYKSSTDLHLATLGTVFLSKGAADEGKDIDKPRVNCIEIEWEE